MPDSDTLSRRARFSVRGLMLLIAFVALGAALLVQSMRLQEARVLAERLRAEAAIQRAEAEARRRAATAAEYRAAIIQADQDWRERPDSRDDDRPAGDQGR